MFSLPHFVRRKSVKCLRSSALEEVKTFVKTRALEGSRFVHENSHHFGVEVEDDLNGHY